MNISTDPWVWIMGIGTIAIFSFVFKENPVYRFFEHLYVGLSAGYAIGVNVNSIYDKAWTPMTQEGRLSLLIPIFLGLLLYARFFKRYAWLTRIPMSLLVGVGSALAIYGGINSQFLAQVKASFMPLNNVNNIIMVLGTLAVLLYFFFSMEQKGAIKYGAISGRWVLMLTFGVAFGNTVMGRISLMLGCFESLLGDWLGLISTM